jgi:hypothetical protein
MIGGSQDHTLTIYVAIHPLAYHLMMLAVMIMVTTLLSKSLYHDTHFLSHSQSDCLGLREMFSPSCLLAQMLYNVVWLLVREDSPVLYRTGALYHLSDWETQLRYTGNTSAGCAHQVASRINIVHYLGTSSLSDLRTNRQKA